MWLSDGVGNYKSELYNGDIKPLRKKPKTHRLIRNQPQGLGAPNELQPSNRAIKYRHQELIPVAVP